MLENVNIRDTERTKKNFENIKSQAGYQAYDNEVVDELTGYFYVLTLKRLFLALDFEEIFFF